MSMLLRLTFKVRMMARMFGKTREIPKTMMINRTMRRGNQDIYLPRKKALFVLSSAGLSTSACQMIWVEKTLFQ